jgi:spore coat polysaccharide biosynthesis protein SpsF
VTPLVLSRPESKRDAPGLVVQIRLGSTRLPGKALLPLGGATMTDQVLSRLGLIPASIHVLATDEASAEALSDIAERQGFELLVGPAEDVLGRYCLAIRRYAIERVIRATGDNPLVSFELAKLLVARAASHGSDYAAYTGMPLGMGVELVSAEALLRAEAEAGEGPEREHVCPYLYNHPEMFSIDRVEAPPEFLLPEGRVTVDTREDYESVLRVYGALYSGSPIPTEQVMHLLKARRSGIVGGGA